MVSALYIARDGKNLGCFTELEVMRGLTAGKEVIDPESVDYEEELFYPHDLVWREGMGEWSPLGEMVARWALSLEALELLEAQEAEEDFKEEDWDALAEPDLVPMPSWERRQEVGFFAALFKTIGEVLFQPHETFTRMSLEGGVQEPLFFSVLLGTVMGWISLSYRLPLFLQHPEKVSSQLATLSHSAILSGFGVACLLYPLFTWLFLWGGAAVIHFFLRFCHFSEEPLSVTVRMFAYLKGALSVFALFPVFASGSTLYDTIAASWGLFSIFYGIYLFFVALRSVHSLSEGKAAVTMVLSFSVVILLSLLLFSFVIPGILS